MNTFQTLLYSEEAGVATIALNRPEVLNAFNALMRRELLAAVQQAAADPDLRVVILTGSGRCFSAGADLAEPSAPEASVRAQLEDEYKPGLMAIAAAPKPFISAVNGTAAGVGASFAMACDLVVMADDASLYIAFAAIGLIPDGGMTWHLAHHLGRKRAFEWIANAEKISARRALELGLANRVVPADALLQQTQDWAKALAEKAPLALRYAKEALHQAVSLDLASTISREAILQEQACRTADAAEAILAFREKRPPKFQGR